MYVGRIYELLSPSLFFAILLILIDLVLGKFTIVTARSESFPQPQVIFGRCYCLLFFVL